MANGVAEPVAQAPGTQKRPFSMRDKLGYMFGDFGNDFTFILQMMFFMLFYTNVVGIEPAHIGLLFLVARIVDGFTDVGMGIIIDRLPVKAGGDKFKRWIKFGAIPVAVASALMYMSFITEWEYGLKLIWMCATYFLWGSIAYTAINIPYGSMASVISSDPDHRAQLSVFRSTGANLAMLVIQAVLPLVVYTKVDGVSVLDGTRMTIAASVCAILAVVCYALCFMNVEERVHNVKAEGEKSPGIGAMLGSIVQNKALLTLILAALLLLLGNLFLSGMLGYIFLSYFNNGALQSVAAMAALLPTFTLVVLAPIFGKRFGKAETGAAAMLIAGIVFLAAYFLKIEQTNGILWVIFYAVGSFCVAIFNFLVWAFITDVIDYQDVRTGHRDDATVYALYSWSRKVGQALAGGLTGFALTAIGFSTADAKAGLAQSDSVLSSLYFLGNVIPGVCFLLVGVVLWFLYPLKKGVIAKNVEILAARRAGTWMQGDPLAPQDAHRS